MFWLYPCCDILWYPVHQSQTKIEFKCLNSIYITLYPAGFRSVPHLTGGSRGSNPAMAPIWSVTETWPPAVKNFQHTKMAHILISVYSVFFQPHLNSKPITINNIHIIDLEYTCSLSSPPLTLPLHLLCHLITYCISTKLFE